MFTGESRPAYSRTRPLEMLPHNANQHVNTTPCVTESPTVHPIARRPPTGCFTVSVRDFSCRQLSQNLTEPPTFRLKYTTFRSRHSPVAVPLEVESLAIVLYDPARVSRNLVVPSSAVSYAGQSGALLASAVVTHFRLWPITTLPPPVALSLSNLSLDTAADGVFSCASLLVRVNGTGEFLLGAGHSSTSEAFVVALCACALSW